MRPPVFLLLLTSAAFGLSYGQWTTLPNPHVKAHDIGNVYEVVHDCNHSWQWIIGPFCEYPRGSGIDHVYPRWRKFEIAALSPPGDSIAYLYAYRYMFQPFAEPSDSLWVVEDYSTVDIPYWHGYEGQSDQDFVCRYSNETVFHESNAGANFEQIFIDRRPLSIAVVEQSYAWNSPPLDDILVHAYRVTPTQFTLRGVYLVLHFYGGIGPVESDKYWQEALNYFDDQSTYSEEDHLAVVTDGRSGVEGQAKSCIGYRLFPPLDSSSQSLRWTFTDNNGVQNPVVEGSKMETPVTIRTESELTSYMYHLVSSGGVSINGANNGSGYLCVGPFSVDVGDTLVFWTAEILGMGTGDVQRKSAILDRLYAKQFRAPRPPPAPRVRVETGNKSIAFQWNSLPGETNPETYLDPNRGDNMEIPFEGYRVYRSTLSINGPWTLLMEYDIAGNGFAHDFGLQHEYVETGLLNNFEYYFAVTAFSKPDTSLGYPSRESRIPLNAVRVTPGTPPPGDVGQVAVVPNPYRGDIAYSSFNPPWERPTGKWTTWFENDRRVQFINLPAHCEVKIYTLSGDLVQTLRHEDQTRGYHDWNLTSYVGQAVSSGLYLFSVEDKATGNVQVGKFVIIR
ncbi:MAG: hypothetical protein EHM80_08285 [Nitrospiraceae bacterium]|nr:MAG: hypothetical protein EHM80_08285 [Nitrospiraceae bacterium]